MRAFGRCGRRPVGPASLDLGASPGRLARGEATQRPGARASSPPPPRRRRHVAVTDTAGRNGSRHLARRARHVADAACVDAP